MIVAAVVDGSEPGVVIPNVWLVDPSGIATVAGADAVALLVASATTAPPGGAGPVSVTVPVTVDPAATESADSEMFCSVSLPMVRVVATLAPLYVAVINTFAASELATVAVNVCVRPPWATTTLAGTVTTALLLASVMVAPPAGAAPSSVTVPVIVATPTTVADESVTPANPTVVDAAVGEGDDPHPETAMHKIRKTID